MEIIIPKNPLKALGKAVLIGFAFGIAAFAGQKGVQYAASKLPLPGKTTAKLPVKTGKK